MDRNNGELAKQLMLFETVARHLNFSVAADHLQVSKGYLSQQIKSLEHTLGSKLLYRSTRKVSLTAAGSVALQQAEKMRVLLSETQEKIWDQQTALEGTIKLTAPTAFAEKILINICHEFTRIHPKIEFVFDVGNEKKNLESREFDLAIRITNTPPTNMVARHLTQVIYWCVASPQYFAKHPAPETPTDLASHNCISLSFWRKWTFFHHTDTQVVEAKGSLCYPQNNLLRQAALLGAGIINVPSYVVEEDVQKGKLVKVLEEYVAEPRLVYVIYPQRTAQPAKLREFVDFLFAHPSFINESS